METEAELFETYFAYGSNMCSRQMLLRCPGAKIVARATLTGFRFMYVQWHEGWGGGVAGIVPDVAGVVHGVVWSLSAENLLSLDGHEPTADGSYYREQVTVCTVDKTSLTAWVYRGMVDEDAPFVPSQRYVDTILRGGQEHNLPVAYISQLTRLSARP